MKGACANFLVAWRGLCRGKMTAALVGAVIALAWGAPLVVRTDGTAAGLREMLVRLQAGGAFAVVFVAVLASAAGTFARERENERLALSLVRPASAFSAALGHYLAYLALAGCALAVSCALSVFPLSGEGGSRAQVRCYRHLSPELPSAGVCAARMLEAYLANPETPANVKEAPRAALLALLTAKEAQRHDAIPPGGEIAWAFPAFSAPPGTPVAVRVRFASAAVTQLGVAGTFSMGEAHAAFSNSVQSVLDVPLEGPVGARELTFRNLGAGNALLRPRKDVELLLPGGTFAGNAVRAHVMMWCLAGLAAAFGIFLSAALARPVAVFTALVFALVVLIAPSVADEFPLTLDIPFADRMGLAISRGISSLTGTFAGLSPVSDLATDRLVTGGELARAVLFDLVALPGALLALAGTLVRKAFR